MDVPPLLLARATPHNSVPVVHSPPEAVELCVVSPPPHSLGPLSIGAPARSPATRPESRPESSSSRLSRVKEAQRRGGHRGFIESLSQVFQEFDHNGAQFFAGLGSYGDVF